MAKGLLSNEDAVGNANRLADVLAEVAEIHLGQHLDSKVRVESFEEVGMLTRDAGFVVRVGTAEYQVTVVRSR